MALPFGSTLLANRPVTRPEVMIDGYPMSGIVKWGDLKTSTRLTGDWQASWGIIRSPRAPLHRHFAFRLGAPVEVMLGPIPVFVGSLPEQDWDAGELIAIGAPREGEGAVCLTATEETTSKGNTLLDQAKARGATSWTRVHDFGNTPLIEADDAADGDISRSVNRWLDAWAAENEKLWYVERDRGLRHMDPTDPTDPTWYVTPGAGELGTASENVVGKVFVRFFDSTDGGALKTASWPATTPTGTLERGAFIGNRGNITPTRAQNIAKGIWTKVGAGQPRWTNSLSLGRNQITHKSGIPPHLALIRGRDPMRLLGQPDPRGLEQHIDAVIGETECDWSAGSINISPDGMADRSFEAVLEEVSPGAVPL